MSAKIDLVGVISKSVTYLLFPLFPYNIIFLRQVAPSTLREMRRQRERAMAVSLFPDESENKEEVDHPFGELGSYYKLPKSMYSFGVLKKIICTCIYRNTKKIVRT